MMIPDGLGDRTLGSPAVYTFDSYTAAVKLRDAATALLPAPPPVVEVPKVAKVKALDFIDAILGRFARVATPEQKDFARYLVCDDWVAGLEVTHYGPTFAELAVKLAALEDSEVVAAPPAVFVEAVVEAIGPVAELGPDGPVDLAAYLASFVADDAEPTYTDATMDRMALDADQVDTLSGHGGSDRVWDAYPRDWYARVMTQIEAAEAAIKAAKGIAPCCPAHEVVPCLGCAAEIVAADLLSAVGPDPLDDADAGVGVTLADFVGFQAEHFRVFDNAACNLIADHLAALAQRIRRSGAASVHQFEEWDQLDDMADRERIEADAWKAGYADAERREFATY